MIAGRTYRVRVEFTNAETAHRTAAGTVTGQPSLMLAALRVGGNYQLDDEEEAIAKAGKIAQECDAVICVTGGNLDWETEGSDRTQFALPGATDLLVDTLLQANNNIIVCNISVSDHRLCINTQLTSLLLIGFRFRLSMGRSRKSDSAVLACR